MGFEDLHLDSTITEKMSENFSFGIPNLFCLHHHTFSLLQDWSPNVSALKKAPEETTASIVGRLNSSTESDQETTRLASESE